MEPDSPEFDKLHQLVTSQLDGELSDEERRELTELLRDNPAAQQLYVETIADVTSIRWWSADSISDAQLAALAGIAPSVANAKTGRSWLGIMSLAAAVLVALTAGMLLWTNAGSKQIADAAAPEPAVLAIDSSNQEVSKPADVATLTRTRGVRWSKDGAELREMSRLSVGQVLVLQEGEAEIFFDQAVQLVVRGPASIEIRSPMEIFSPFGVISARVGETGKGFVIQTPTGRITDLGTEFGVAIGKKGTTDVAVFRGAVDLAYGMQDLNVNTRLFQGQALHVDSNGSLRRLVAINNNRFPSIHGGPRNRTSGSSIFLDVDDNISQRLGAKFYRIVPGGLAEDVPAYVDRQHEWNGVDQSGIPEFLLGADYVMPFNEDKWAPTLEVTLQIGQPAVLFVFLTNKAHVPDWLKADFVDTGLKIGLDEHAEFSNPVYEVASGPGEKVDTIFSIWKREVPAPTSITLGSVRQIPRSGWGYCMYGIAAIPLESATNQQP
ncbi:MAG: FecR domain-containing protein [Pirellulales bacterium]